VCDLCGTQTANGGPHIYGHCANDWLREARRRWRTKTDAAVHDHGDEGLWGQKIWREVWSEDTLVDALFGCSFAPGDTGDLADGRRLTEAFIATFGKLDQSQAEATGGLPPARKLRDTAAAADDVSETLRAKKRRGLRLRWTDADSRREPASLPSRRCWQCCDATGRRGGPRIAAPRA
jgi:hypothetical protein